MLLAATLFMSAAARGADEAQAVVPVVANVIGFDGVHWKCRVEIRNDFNYPMEIVLSLPTVEGEPFMLQTLEPGQVIGFNDIVGEAFGLHGIIGPLVVRAAGRRAPTVITTTYGIYRGAFTIPQYTPAVYGPSPHYVGMLRGLAANAAWRTNIGMVNLGEKPATFTAALQLVPGRNVAVAHLEIPPYGVVQAPARDFFPLMTEAENFSVVVDSNMGETYTYAAVIVNKTNDSRYVTPGAVVTGR